MGKATEINKKLTVLNNDIETLKQRVKLLELQLKEMQNKNIIQSEVIHLDDEKTKSKKGASNGTKSRAKN